MGREQRLTVILQPPLLDKSAEFEQPEAEAFPSYLSIPNAIENVKPDLLSQLTVTVFIGVWRRFTVF